MLSSLGIECELMGEYLDAFILAKGCNITHKHSKRSENRGCAVTKMGLRGDLETELRFLVIRLYAKLSYIRNVPAADFFTTCLVLLWWPDLMLLYVQHSSAACHC